MKIFKRSSILLVLVYYSFLICFFSDTLFAQINVEVNNSVRLKAFSQLGIPLHPESGSGSVSDRLPDRSIVDVHEIDPDNGWINISGSGISGWIVKRYIAEIIPSTSNPIYCVVGCWNLEHFHDGASRGFPENTRGGPSYPARTQSDYEAIAAIIENLEVRILVLEEIYAQEVQGSVEMQSLEVEKIIHILGEDNYSYIIGHSGRSQHIALLFDQRYARLNAEYEFNLPDERINSKWLFDRQPLVAHFTLLNGSQTMNDIAVVGVHLASGQPKRKNHDRAMELIVEEIENLRLNEICIPTDENDILIMGDFNANRFDSYDEEFWDDMEGNGWDVLADNDSDYPATRLSGHPLKLDKSKIDYIIVTKGNHGLFGEEITEAQALVHTGLINPNAEAFRGFASEHLPVTIRIRVTTDTDVSQN